MGRLLGNMRPWYNLSEAGVLDRALRARRARGAAPPLRPPALRATTVRQPILSIVRALL